MSSIYELVRQQRDDYPRHVPSHQPGVRRTSLDATEKKRVEKEAGFHASYVKFKGFDGNNDEHFGVTKYLVEDLGRYGELEKTGLNSHSRGSLPTYRSMLQEFKKIENPHEGLTADQIVQVLKAEAKE